MIVFPNAKINLGLRVLSKREDGYHNIESCLYPIPWQDVLEIIPARELVFTHSGLEIPGNEEDNLCLKAYHLVRKTYNLPPVQIHLHKVIPMGAGLGGGSADGAFTLKALNDIFGLKLDGDSLRNLAAQLGSDCSFFISNQPSLVTGTGTTLEPNALNLAGLYLLVRFPGINVSTREAYQNIQPAVPDVSLKEILKRPAKEWKDSLTNDFERAIFSFHPELRKLKESLYEKGALYAAMSGSGSAVFGLFERKTTIKGFSSFIL